jgi:hypothetical protein
MAVLLGFWTCVSFFASLKLICMVQCEGEEQITLPLQTPYAWYAFHYIYIYIYRVVHILMPTVALSDEKTFIMDFVF